MAKSFLALKLFSFLKIKDQKQKRELQIWGLVHSWGLLLVLSPWATHVPLSGQFFNNWNPGYILKLLSWAYQTDFELFGCSALYNLQGMLWGAQISMSTAM